MKNIQEKPIYDMRFLMQSVESTLPNWEQACENRGLVFQARIQAFEILGSSHEEKNGKKRGHCPLLATPPP